MLCTRGKGPFTKHVAVEMRKDKFKRYLEVNLTYMGDDLGIWSVCKRREGHEDSPLLLPVNLDECWCQLISWKT